MSWTLCTSGAAKTLAGVDIPTDMTTSKIDVLSDYVEGLIEMETKRSWVANYATIPSGAQNTLGAVAAAKIANLMIKYDINSYPSKQMAGLMIDYNDDIADEGMKVLQNFISSSALKAP